MFIEKIIRPWRAGEPYEFKLKRPGLILDPRANYPRDVRLAYNYHDDDGLIVTITLIDDDSNGSQGYIGIRIYDPTIEAIPRFDTTTYTYLGIDGERTPRDTIVAVIDPSVRTIKKLAFRNCKKLKIVIMHNEVECINERAFMNCSSLEALFLPQRLHEIKDFAFNGCESLKIMPLLSDDLDVERIGFTFVFGCYNFREITQTAHVQYSSDQLNRAILEFYRFLPPLHKECLDINVSIQSIQECIRIYGTASASNTVHGGMTPLHILSLNPHADTETIMGCFNVNKGMALVRDMTDKNVFDYLREYHMESHTALMTALCIHRNGMNE